MDVTAPMGQCPWPGTRTCKYTFPVWTSDNFERLPSPASQREQGLSNLKPKDKVLSTRVIFRLASFTKGPRVMSGTLAKVCEADASGSVAPSGQGGKDSHYRAQQ